MTGSNANQEMNLMLQHQLVVQQILAKENSQITQVRNTFLNLMAISWAESSAPA